MQYLRMKGIQHFTSSECRVPSTVQNTKSPLNKINNSVCIHVTITLTVNDFTQSLGVAAQNIHTSKPQRKSEPFLQA